MLIFNAYDNWIFISKLNQILYITVILAQVSAKIYLLFSEAYLGLCKTPDEALLQKWLMAFSRYLFRKNVPSQMFRKVLKTPVFFSRKLTL